jgi:hypothetical protein
MDKVVDLKSRPKIRPSASAEDARFSLQEAARGLTQLESLLWMITKHASDERNRACEASHERIAIATGACQELAHRAGTHAATQLGILFGKEAAARVFEPFL